MRVIMSKRAEKRLSTRQGRLEVAQEVNERMQERRLRAIKAKAEPTAKADTLFAK